MKMCVPMIDYYSVMGISGYYALYNISIDWWPMIGHYIDGLQCALNIILFYNILMANNILIYW